MSIDYNLTAVGKASEPVRAHSAGITKDLETPIFSPLNLPAPIPGLHKLTQVIEILIAVIRLV